MDFRPHGTGQKKLIIKNFTGPRKLPKNYDVDSWRMLEEAVRAIQSLGQNNDEQYRCLLYFFVVTSISSNKL